MNKIFKLSLGDPSNDGHGMYKNLFYKSNKTVKELQKAYRKSCKLTKVQFHINSDYTGLNPHGQWGGIFFKTRIFTDCDDSRIYETAKRCLEENGLNVDSINKNEIWTPRQGAVLILEFIKLSCPDFTYQQVSKPKDYKTKWYDSLAKDTGERMDALGYGLFDWDK